jgi:simple sugar transport system ATP-binding protein
VLTPQEADELAVALRGMVEQGKTVVFISHKLDEVIKVTDQVTVLRAGRKVFTSLTSDTSKNQLAREMIGRKPSDLKRTESAFTMALVGAGEEGGPAHHDKETAETQAALTVRDLHVRDDRGLLAVRGMNFNIQPGKILGIAGVDGNGQRELAEAITGQRRFDRGQVWVAREESTDWAPRDYIEHNVAVITEDRQAEGLILNFDVSRNAVLKIFRRKPFAHRGLLNVSSIVTFAQELIETFDVMTPGPHVAASTLSGGNQQKLVLARELSQSPALIIANKPTRGLDIGAAAYIHQKLADERARGAAILLISGDLDELLSLSDRILVMFDGQNMGALPLEETDLEKIGLMMGGTPQSDLGDRR